MKPPAAPPATGDPLPALLRALAGTLAADAVDTVWLFPTREAAKSRSAVVVVSAFEEKSERRRVITAQRLVRPDDKGRPAATDQVDEHGSAPADRIERLVEGVLRRLSDDLATAPRRVEIGGDADRWAALLAELVAGASDG